MTQVTMAGIQGNKTHKFDVILTVHRR